MKNYRSKYNISISESTCKYKNLINRYNRPRKSYKTPVFKNLLNSYF